MESFLKQVDDTCFDELKRCHQWTSLHVACAKNDSRAVDALLQTTTEINNIIGSTAPVWQGYTPLHIAITCQYTSVTRILLEHNVDICVPNAVGMTPLHLADEFRMTETVKMLLESRCMRYDVNPRNKKGLSHFHIACKTVGNNQKIIESFFATGVVDINAMLDFNGFTPLHLCVNHSSWVGAMILLQHGADFTKRNAYGQTPFEMAYKRNDRSMFRVLLDDQRICSGDVQKKLGLDHYLRRFCTHGFSEIVTNLLAKGVDPNIPDIIGKHAGYTALHLAVEHGNIEVVESLLMDSRTLINALNQSKKTPLHLAVRISRVDIVQMLVSNGASVIEQDLENHTALHLAKLRKDGPIIRVLLAALKVYFRVTPDTEKVWHYYKKSYYIKSVEFVNIISTFPAAVPDTYNAHNGITDPISLLKSITLHLAVYKGDLEMIQELLADGVYLNVQNSYGSAPLHTCIEKDNNISLILIALLDAGANINIQTNRGETALHLALALCKYDIVELLINRGANLRLQDQDGITALHAIAGYKDDFDSLKEKLRESLSSSSLVDIVDRQGLTPLHYAVKNNSMGYIKLLLHFKADPNKRNNLLETPMHTACKNADLGVIQLLLKAGASVNLRDHADNLPIHGVVHNKCWREHATFNEDVWLFYVRILHELLIAGGHDLDIDIKNARGHSTLDIAVLQNNQECIDALMHCDANFNLQLLRLKCRCPCPMEKRLKYLIQMDILGLKPKVNMSELNMSFLQFRNLSMSELHQMTGDFRFNECVSLDKIIRSAPIDIARYSLHKNVKGFIEDEKIFTTYPLFGQLIVSRILYGQRIPMEIIECGKYILSDISFSLTENGLPDACTEAILRNLTPNDLYNLSETVNEKM